MPKRIKAYEVCERDEGCCTIVFDTDNASARRAGALKLDSDWCLIKHCRRAPQFDRYAELGAVPPLVLIDAGWRFECDHCGRAIDLDADDEDTGPELNPAGDKQGHVFCCPEHMMLAWAETQLRRAQNHATIEAALTFFHGCPIHSISAHQLYKAGGRDIQLTAQFDFPGRKGALARWPVGSATVLVSSCDRYAWSAMRNGAKTASGLHA